MLKFEFIKTFVVVSLLISIHFKPTKVHIRHFGKEALAMKTEDNTCTGRLLRDSAGLKTRGIWEDAGFTPPPVYMHLTEFLHIAYSNDGPVSGSYLKMIIDAVNTPESLNSGLFEINDRKKMYSFAESLGIDILAEDDARIAAGITKNILSDYMSSDCAPFAAEIFLSQGKMN